MTLSNYIAHFNDTFALEYTPKRHIRTNSASASTVLYDDVKLPSLTLFLPSGSLPTSRSSSSLGSDYGNNPKYRTQKPPWARSELELFRSRAERYSVKRRQPQKGGEEKDENSGNDEELPGPASSTLVRPDGRRVSVCTSSNKWIVHWHEQLRRKSLEDVTKNMEHADHDIAASGSPILRVSPPTPSPASSLAQLDTQASSTDRFDSDLTNTVFDLVRRKDGGRGSLPQGGKNTRQESLTPPGGHSRQDSTSSVESISALFMAAQERQAVATLPSVDLEELEFNGADEPKSPTVALPIPFIRKQRHPSIAREGSNSDSSDEMHNKREVRPRRSGSRTSSLASSRGSRPPSPSSLPGSRPHSLASSFGSQPHIPALSHSRTSLSTSPCNRHNTPDDKPILPNKLKLTPQGFRPMLSTQQQIVMHQMNEIQNCPCGGIHPDTPPPSPVFSSSPQSDDFSSPKHSDKLDLENGTPPLMRRDMSYMPPSPLPQVESPFSERGIFDISTDNTPVISTPKLIMAHRTGARSSTLPTRLQRQKGIGVFLLKIWPESA